MLKFDNTKGELGNLSKIRKPVESLCVTRMIGLYKSTAEKKSFRFVLFHYTVLGITLFAIRNRLDGPLQ